MTTVTACDLHLHDGVYVPLNKDPYIVLDYGYR